MYVPGGRGGWTTPPLARGASRPKRGPKVDTSGVDHGRKSLKGEERHMGYCNGVLQQLFFSSP